MYFEFTAVRFTSFILITSLPGIEDVGTEIEAVLTPMLFSIHLNLYNLSLLLHVFHLLYFEAYSTLITVMRAICCSFLEVQFHSGWTQPTKIVQTDCVQTALERDQAKYNAGHWVDISDRETIPDLQYETDKMPAS